jgi:lantibiotic modifying enzyme
MNSSTWKERALGGLEKLAGCRYENFAVIQSPPYRSLNNGATGVAYTFWKAACILDDPNWLHYARLWIDHVVASPEDDRVVGIPESEGGSAEVDIEDSLYHGNRGVQFVKALVSYAQADDYHLNKFLSQYEKPAARERDVQDLLQGTPGRLVGFAIMYDEMQYPYIKEQGESLARELLSTADLTSEETLWGNNPYKGMAHGRGGILYSLLFWSKVSGSGLPDRIRAEIRRHAESGLAQSHGMRWPISDGDDGQFMDSWCHGTPGLLHLWSLAYEVYGDSFFLGVARQAGEFLTHREAYDLGHICCGAAGASYAILSLNRIDPDGGWLDHAAMYAEMAEKARTIHRFRLGLYTGLAGVVCLMLDMIDPKQARQPAFQG